MDSWIGFSIVIVPCKNKINSLLHAFNQLTCTHTWSCMHHTHTHTTHAYASYPSSWWYTMRKDHLHACRSLRSESQLRGQLSRSGPPATRIPGNFTPLCCTVRFLYISSNLLDYWIRKVKGGWVVEGSWPCWHQFQKSDNILSISNFL